MTININPVIGHLGPFVFHWYGVIMAVAVVVGFFVNSKQLKRRGISPDHALGMAVVAVPCGIIGARIVHLIDNLGFYWHHPGQIIGLQLVGLAIYGVMGGGLLGLVLYCHWKKLPVLRVLDSAALALPIGQIIGNFANIINGDTWGTVTKLPWGFKYVNPGAFLPANLLGVSTHPTPVYEQLWLLVILGVLLYALPRLKTDGMAIVLYLGLYSFGRFFLSFFRVNNSILFGLKEAQLIAIAVLVLVFPAAWLLRRRARNRMSSLTLDSSRSPEGVAGATDSLTRQTS
jgi:phosphatidylglycerol---prolipoprotein diacylglyceryl transferase